MNDQDYHFRILRVDLSTRKTMSQTVPLEVIDQYIGGSSLAAWLLYPFLTRDLDPLSPEAPLLFLTGPLSGTLGPAVGRYVVCAKSPATGLWGESNVGGNFGAELRTTGYDGLLLVGKSDSPTYLVLDESGISFRDATHLWGIEDTYSTQERIKSDLEQPGVKVACIGKAGENEIPYALILCDHGRVAGRTGMGAVMGSKNLKAIAVQGKKAVPIVDEQRFGELRRRANIELRQDNSSRVLRQMGTAGGSDFFDYLGSMPKRYFSKGTFRGTEKVSGAAMEETILSGVSTCNGCVVACGRVVTLGSGRKRKGPEYETIVGFGPNLEIVDLNAITHLGELCDRYGMDTISLSNIIGLLMLLYQEGRMSAADTGGLSLEWGSPSVAEAIIHQTVEREGIGAFSAKGARWIADHFGVPGMAAQVNGLEVAFHDPRSLSGMAVVYATSPRGACHNQSDYYMVDAWSWTEEELGITRYGRQEGSEKVDNIVLHQDWRTVCNSLVVCILPSPPVKTLLECFRAVTGLKMSTKDLMLAGERGWNLKRLINLKLGLDREDEQLPDILMTRLSDGGGADYIPPFEEMMSAYYTARSWDIDTGTPSRGKIEELDLQEFDFRRE